MILEGIVTTLDSNGNLNVAPMGPIVDESMSRLCLRPFRSSNTYRNLKSKPYGVFHVVDDVLLIAQAALDLLENLPQTFAAEKISGRVLSSGCRWYEFEVAKLDDSTERTSIDAEVIHVGHIREPFGFNRAKHAVLEATILATRLHLLKKTDVFQQLAILASAVEKTAGPKERMAFDLVMKFTDDWYRREPSEKFS